MKALRRVGIAALIAAAFVALSVSAAAAQDGDPPELDPIDGPIPPPEVPPFDPPDLGNGPPFQPPIGQPGPPFPYDPPFGPPWLPGVPQIPGPPQLPNLPPWVGGGRGRGPDFIIYNAPIITMNPGQPGAAVMAVQHGVITDVGTFDRIDEILATAGPQTRLIDAKGFVVMPGFVDAHNHIFNQDNYGATLAERQAAALENGYTTMGNLYTDESFLPQMEAFAASGDLRIRTSLYLVYNTACGNVIGNWYMAHPPTRVPGERLRIGGVKVFTDGGSCNEPSFSEVIARDTFLADPYVTVPELTAVIQEAQGIGHQVAIHAIGDRAIDVALDSVQAALDGAPNTYRHRIEHNAVLRGDQLPRYSEIGVIPTIFADYPSCGTLGEPLFPAYQDWEWRYDELAAENPDLHIAWHSDAPYFDINPFHQLFGFVTRYDVAPDGSTCAPQPWLSDDTFPVADALAMMTTESAYALFRESEVGSLEVGKYADFLVIDANPLTVPDSWLKDIDVRATVINGISEYCESGSESVCP